MFIINKISFYTCPLVSLEHYFNAANPLLLFACLHALGTLKYYSSVLNSMLLSREVVFSREISSFLRLIFLYFVFFKCKGKIKLSPCFVNIFHKRWAVIHAFLRSQFLWFAVFIGDSFLFVGDAVTRIKNAVVLHKWIHFVANHSRKALFCTPRKCISIRLHAIRSPLFRKIIENNVFVFQIKLYICII